MGNFLLWTWGEDEDDEKELNMGGYFMQWPRHHLAIYESRVPALSPGYFAFS